MSQVIRISNLGCFVDEERLTELLCHFGKLLNVHLVQDSFSHTCIGYGFAEFEREEDAWASIDALDGTYIDGRLIHLQCSRISILSGGVPPPPRELLEA